MTINEIFSTIVKKWRNQHGWTQQNLANNSNCKIKTIQRIEGGDYTPSERMMSMIFSAFKNPSAKINDNLKSSILRRMDNASDIFECFKPSKFDGEDFIYDININNLENREKVYPLLKLLFELHDMPVEDFLKLRGSNKFEWVKKIDEELNKLRELNVHVLGDFGQVPPDRDTAFKTFVYAFITEIENETERIVKIPNIPLNHYEQRKFTPLKFNYVNNDYQIFKSGWEPIYLSEKKDLENLLLAIERIIMGGETEVSFLRKMQKKPKVNLTIRSIGQGYSLIPPVNPEGYQCTFEELFFLAKDVEKTISFLNNKKGE